MPQTTLAADRLTPEVLEFIRRQFVALQRLHQGAPLVYLDGPAGTQVPQAVADAVTKHMLRHNANHGGAFITSRESDAIVAEAHRAMADLIGVSDPDEIIFGPNMTTLTWQLSRALARTWSRGDEIVVTQMDHDANIRPWVVAAEERGATVRMVPVDLDDFTLDQQAYGSLLGPRTRLVALGCASNSIGTINPVGEMIRQAHAVGAEVFLDAVHYAPHRLIDVPAWDCDYLACSAYKFFGPHVGVLWGRRSRLESLEAYKLVPAPNSLPGKWMTGTQNFACQAGALAAVNYLADLGRSLAGDAALQRRPALEAAYARIAPYEQALIWEFDPEGLSAIDGVRVIGIEDRGRAAERMPTLSLVVDGKSSAELAGLLARRGICAWHGNFYAWELSRALGREPEGMLRLGLVHYNTAEEVQRTVEAIDMICGSQPGVPFS